MPVRGRIYLATVIAVGAIAVVWAALDMAGDAQAETAVLVLSLVSIAIEHSTPAMRRYGNTNIGVQMTLPISIAAGLIAGPGGAAIVGLVSGLVNMPVSWVKRSFNAANFVLSALAAGFVLLATGADTRVMSGDFDIVVLVDIVLAGSAYVLVNAILIVGVLWAVEVVPPRAVVFGAMLRTAPSHVAYGFLGLMIAVLWPSLGALAAVLVVLPLVVARWAFSQFAREQEAYEATIRTLVQAVETKDHYTRGHSERVAKASVMIARVLAIREDRVTALRYAGILHDVGKLGVPTTILQKTTGLSDDEFASIQKHPLHGMEMLRDIEFLDEAIKGIRHHHERLDGLGYPEGLRGDEIPEFARVIAVADAFDSMTSTRSYRGARTSEDAVLEIERCRGTQFDAVMVDALVQALRKEPWVPTTVEPREGESELPASLDHDDPTVDVVAGRERDR